MFDDHGYPLIWIDEKASKKRKITRNFLECLIIFFGVFFFFVALTARW